MKRMILAILTLALVLSLSVTGAFAHCHGGWENGHHGYGSSHSGWHGNGKRG